MKVIDLHQDILLHQASQEKYKYKNQTSLDMLMLSDVRLVFGTGFVFGEGAEDADGKKGDDFFAANCMELIERDIDSYIAYAKENPDFVIVKNASDLELVCSENTAGNSDISARKRGVIIHIEGLNTFQDTEECWNMLERFYEKGLRSIGITWILENGLGGGNEAGADSGLTPLGEKVIQWALEKGVLVDCSHMNEKTFYEVANLGTSGQEGEQKMPAMPIFISHGNARAVCANMRNYSDEQLLAVKASGGLIGIFFANNCLVNEGLATIDDVIKHITYIRDLIGIDFVAIGSDLGGLSLNIPEGLRDIFSFGNLKDALLAAGFSEDDVTKIFYQNALRFLKLSFGAKSSIMQ